MNDECLVCQAPLEYRADDEKMKCALCGQVLYSKTRCANGHFVCDACHMGGLQALLAPCLRSREKNPLPILEEMMASPACPMHGPEHHTLVGAALLAAYKNAGGELDLPCALTEMHRRAQQVPGGACGFWGACGAGISAGIYLSIVLKATPLDEKAWGLCNRLTAAALEAIGQNGGPRCCKRDAYLALGVAAQVTRDKLGIPMELPRAQCRHFAKNNQCLQEKCVFHPPMQAENALPTA